MNLNRRNLLKKFAAAAAAASVLVLVDASITGPANVVAYRTSADEREITLTAALLPVDTIIRADAEEHDDRVVVSVRIRRIPVMSKSIAIFRAATIRLEQAVGDRAVVDEAGRPVPLGP